MPLLPSRRSEAVIRRSCSPAAICQRCYSQQRTARRDAAIRGAEANLVSNADDSIRRCQAWTPGDRKATESGYGAPPLSGYAVLGAKGDRVVCSWIPPATRDHRVVAGDSFSHDAE
jgi:hypothetical protein